MDIANPTRRSAGRIDKGFGRFYLRSCRENLLCRVYMRLGVWVKCPHPCMLPRQGTYLCICIWQAVVGGKSVGIAQVGCHLKVLLHMETVLQL